MKCDHEFEQIHEQSLLGGTFPVGWHCIKCNLNVEQSQLTPEGLSGKVINQHRLVGPIETASGITCKEQVIRPDGTLEYIK